MADKKLIDLPLETAQDSDEIYAVRNEEFDIRVKLGDVLHDRVRKPVNVSPSNTEPNVSPKPILIGGGYSSIYTADTRQYREFQVSLKSDIEFESPVFTIESPTDSIVVTTLLNSNEEYIWRCRDIASSGNVSKWSSATEFTTTNAPVIATPTLISPENGATSIAFNPLLISSEYSTILPEYVRTNRQFQLTMSSDTNFVSPIDDVLVNSDEYQVDVGLLPNEEYIWRCRDIAKNASEDVLESSWSDVFSFTTKAGEVVKPSVVSPSNGTEGYHTRTVKSSEFAVIGGEDSLSGSEWEFYDDSDNLAHSSGLVSGIQYEYSDMSTLTTYKVRVKHVGVSYGESEWSDFVEFTTGEAFLEPYSYLSIVHATAPYVTIYKRSGDIFTKLANPSELPTNTGNGASFSTDGNYLAIVHNNFPYVTIYKRNGDTFTKLANPSQLPTGTGRGASFSPDGNYLSIAHGISPFVTIYKRSGDTFTKLANPSELPTSNGYGASFSPDGNYLSIEHVSSPFVTIYKRSGDTFTKLADPSQLPTGSGYGASFSPDGNYLSIAHQTSPLVTIYKRSGDTFTKLADPSQLPTGSGRGASFSTDGNYLAIVHNNFPYVTIYKRNGDTFTKLANPSQLPTSLGYGVNFSPDGNYLAIAHSGSPYITIYKRNGDTFDKVNDPLELPTGIGYGASFSPTIIPPTPGSIGTPGRHGFGVGTCTNESWLTELGLSEMEGTNDYMHDNYGNYIHTNSSQMVFIPKFYYRIGSPNHPKYDIFGANSLEIVGIETYETETEANADGFILHRAFIDGGQEKIGFFVDKYHLSQKADDNSVGVSVRYGVPISLTTATGFARSSTMPNCNGTVADSITLCRARGAYYNQCSAFMLSALAMLSLAHGQYATSTDACAWYDPTYTTNYPKGCNTALKDVNDETVTFTSASESGDVNKPLTGSGTNLAKTSHNGQNCGVIDLNGSMYDVGIGITSFGSNSGVNSAINNSSLQVLKDTVTLSSLTAGWNGANDVWQSAANIGTYYNPFTCPVTLSSTATAVFWGNGTNQVLNTDMSGSLRAVAGIFGASNTSFSATGTNLFGNDYCYKYNRQNLVILFGGSWASSSSAGMFARYMNSHRNNSYDNVAPRACAYPNNQ